MMLTGAAALSHGRAARGAGDGEPRSEPASPATAAPAPHTAVPDNALYRKDCRRCHGADGKGLKRDRLRELPDFTDADWQSGRGDADLQVSILEGKGTHMPPFGDSVSQDQARELVAYIRQLGGRSAARQAAPTDFERRFRQLEAEMRDLMRQFDAVSTPPLRTTQVKDPRVSRRRRSPERSQQVAQPAPRRGG
jgi:mono/diheme cytochrome c family protein